MIKKIENMIKIAVSAEEKSLKSEVSDVFGRCPYFAVVQIEDKKIEKVEFIENDSVNKMSGAGIFAGRLMSEKNVNFVITKNVGPRALDVLKQFNIQVYFGENSIEQALQKFIDGKLKRID